MDEEVYFVILNMTWLVVLWHRKFWLT